MVKKKKLKLKVIFDTNVVYTGSASDLLRNEIVELINKHKTLNDIEIEWYIPDTVVKERIFQMNKKGNELLPSIQKLEKLLGHNLNITKEIIEERILGVVKKQLVSLGIETIKIDVTKVDWELIINNSLNRQIPFEDNEKEKGFRDALILECLKKVISDSPKTKSICRIAFITNDNILNRAATEIGSSSLNVNVFQSVVEFVSLINILDSEITEDLINKIIEDSNRLFFEENDDTTLYYTQQIRKHILENFSKELNAKQDGSNIRENGTWWISKPGFEEKNKQQVIWKTIISVDFIEYKISWSELSSGARDNYYSLSGQNMSLGMLPATAPGNVYSSPMMGIGLDNTRMRMGIGIGIGSTMSPSVIRRNPSREQMSQVKEKIGEGQTRFEVTWTVTLSTDNKLKNPKITSIEYLDSNN